MLGTVTRAVALVCLLPASAWAGCFPIAARDAPLRVASAAPVPLPEDATLRLTFLGHASFLIESAEGVTAVTDYNGVHRAPFAPRIVTMNNAHATHWTSRIEPGVEHVLRGWDPAGGIVGHDLRVDDVRVRSVATSVRGRTDALANSNAIFVFEVADLCVAHLGHLHHALEDYHLGELGIIDVLLVPVDGMWTMPHATAVEVIEQIDPSVVVPMHYFGRSVLESFLALLDESWTVRWQAEPTWTVSRLSLPYREVLVLPGP
ncbi:MAG: MBL fold metallo-hydrolase [Pseudomonadota bacterium]